MLPSCSRILTEAISIAFTSLQQRQSISLASFLQCTHLHQSRFPILICNKSAAEVWICLVSFSWLSFQSRFPILICNKTAAEAQICLISKVATGGVPVKKGVLKNFANFSAKYLCWSWSVYDFRPVALLKRDCNTGFFLWNLRNC